MMKGHKLDGSQQNNISTTLGVDPRIGWPVHQPMPAPQLHVETSDGYEDTLSSWARDQTKPSTENIKFK